MLMSIVITFDIISLQGSKFDVLNIVRFIALFADFVLGPLISALSGWHFSAISRPQILALKH